MLSKIISDVDAFVWGPVMLVLLVGTGILLTIRCNFLTWRNLPWAIIKTLSKESRTKNRGEGDVSPFSALTTALAATIGIALFAFSTILGWEYHGEKAFEYLMGTHKFNMIYRIIFSLVAYVGATQTLELVWNFSDIANALMAIPNLICMLLLSGEIAKDVKEFQKTIEEEKAGK